MPKLGHELPVVEAVFQLQAVGATIHGERVGHSGSTISPTTTRQHQQKHDVEGPRHGEKDCHAATLPRLSVYSPERNANSSESKARPGLKEISARHIVTFL